MAEVKQIHPGKKPEPLEVKKENVIFFEIDAHDDYSYDNLSPEEKADLAEKNNAFEHNVIQRLLLDRAAPCQCQTPRIMKRLETKMRLGTIQPGPNGQIPVELTQEDVDTRQFGVIVTSNNGVYSGVSMIITKCKGCGDIHLHGDIEAITRCFATAIANEIDIETHRAAMDLEGVIAKTMERDGESAAPTDDGPAFVLENTETGERTGADDLGSTLFGGQGSDAIRTEPVETTEQPAPEE